jgi:hypothetical protein
LDVAKLLAVLSLHATNLCAELLVTLVSGVEFLLDLHQLNTRIEQVLTLCAASHVNSTADGASLTVRYGELTARISLRLRISFHFSA